MVNSKRDGCELMGKQVMSWMGQVCECVCFVFLVVVLFQFVVFFVIYIGGAVCLNILFLSGVVLVCCFIVLAAEKLEELYRYIRRQVEHFPQLKKDGLYRIILQNASFCFESNN